MRNIVFMTIFSFIAISVSAQNIEPINGFRDMSWGASLDEAMPKLSLTLKNEHGPVKTFISPNDSHQLGTVNLREIYYYFHKEAGFFKVVLSGDEKDNDDMDAILKNRLGKKFERLISPTHSNLIWEIGDVTANYRQQFSQDFSLSLRSEVIADYKKEMNEVITDF